MFKFEAVHAVMRIVDDFPLAKVSEEVISSMKASGEGIAKRIQIGDSYGFAVNNTKGSLLTIDGRLAVRAAGDETFLLSQDGASLLMADKNVTFGLPNGTLVWSDGKIVSTRLPSGKIISQEFTNSAQNQSRVMVDGKQIPYTNFTSTHRFEGIQLESEKQGSWLTLEDKTYIRHSPLDFEINRGTDSSSWWFKSPPPIRVLQRFLNHEPSQPRLNLHHPNIKNNDFPTPVGGHLLYQSEYVQSLPGKLAVRVDASSFVDLKELLRQ